MKRFAACLLFFVAFAASADERILNFHSEIRVLQDGWIEVTETIRVRAEGNRIRRGIYRDFPTEYYDKLGNRYEVDFRPLAVLRNNLREDFHAQEHRNGYRVYFGSSNRFIESGEHTYMFRYKANRLLGFFEEHDELYWNVTGFDWAFPIDMASATVTFAFDVSANEITHEAYTGPYGSSERNYTSRVDGSGRTYFKASGPLSAINGLTIVVGWPKGYIEEPTKVERVRWLLNDNLNLLIALAGFVLLLVYYIPVWRRYGRDPEEGVLVTRYEPPKGFSPASLRFIRQMYYDDKVMTAAVLNLAVKGYLSIDVTEGSDGFLGIGKEADEHSLRKTDVGANPPSLAPGEKELYEGLFKEGDEVVLENENHELLGEAKSAHRDSLKKDYRQHYFQTNGFLNIPAIVIVVGSTAASLSFGPSGLVITTIIAMFVIMVLFAIIMKRPTLRGQQLLDEMLGFKDYLEIAEKDELNLRNPPEKTPALFEAYLPYALALGVDQSWAEKFSEVLASSRQADGTAYSPAWYGGSWNSHSLGSTMSNLSGGLSTAISSSVTPPGSSSGGGGGGGGW